MAAAKALMYSSSLSLLSSKLPLLRRMRSLLPCLTGVGRAGVTDAAEVVDVDADDVEFDVDTAADFVDDDNNDPDDDDDDGDDGLARGSDDSGMNEVMRDDAEAVALASIKAP